MGSNVVNSGEDTGGGGAESSNGCSRFGSITGAISAGEADSDISKPAGLVDSTGGMLPNGTGSADGNEEGIASGFITEISLRGRILTTSLEIVLCDFDLFCVLATGF